MKVVLDLDRLLHEGQIDRAEYDKLSRLAARETGSLAINILIGFGVVAVAAGALALVPTPATAVVLGGILLAAGLGGVYRGAAQWSVLANIVLIVGAIMFAGGIVTVEEGSIASFLLVAAVFAGAGIVARSGLMIAGAVLALSCCVGMRTGYMHATYFLGVQEPALTVVLFSLLALATYWLSKQVPRDYESLVLTAARTSLFLVNLGFWIGSLWGDRLAWLRSRGDPARADLLQTPVIPDWAFAIAWALALLAVGAWAVRANRRWVVNIVAVFGAIHFYTQWFERLGATPATILLGGLLVLAFAFALWQFNRRLDNTA
jgi:hypothetical protein